MPSSQPPRRPRPQQSARPKHENRRDRESRFPLDPSYLTQRSLADDGRPQVPVCRMKSGTRSLTIFRKRIDDIESSARHGDLVHVVSPEGSIGYGLWNPRAELAVRILSSQPLDGAKWWRAKLAEAVSLRRDSLKLEEQSDAWRIINAEGDGFPGLVADRYGDLVSVEVFTLAMWQRAEAIARELAQLLGVPHWVVRPGPRTLDQEGFIAEGFASEHAPEKILCREHDLQYEILPFEGHKTGFFCDQRDNRQRLRDYCRGARVLDLCAYTGGFSLNAADAGAKSVTAVDLDEEAIRVAKRNAQLNQKKIKFVHADAFSYLRDMQRNDTRFDVVILDPPKLIHDRSDYTDGQNRYFDLNKLAGTVVAPGGLLLTCSCSGLLPMDQFTRTVRAALGERTGQLLQRTGAGADHPVALGSLESEYLKCLWLRMGEESATRP